MRYSSTSRIRTVVEIGDNLRAILAEQQDAYAEKITAATIRVGERLQEALRAQVRAARLGTGLEKAWRQANYPPRRRSLRPAALVYSRATALHDAFDAGSAILPRKGRFLVIALPEAVARGYDRSSHSRKGGPVPAGQKRKASMLDKASRELRARIVSTAPGPNRRRRRRRQDASFRPYILLAPAKRRGNLVALFFEREDSKGVPLFSLIRASRNPKLLDIDAAAKAAEADLASELNKIEG